MFKKTKVCSAVMLALGAVGQSAIAQQDLERVEVTGSAIKQIANESALPVQVITRRDIEKSGVTNTTDLLQRLPAMQNSTVEGSAVGGETFGFAGVSIHTIGETRTLLLLNGHRVAKLGGQAVTGALNAVDLNSLPLAAIERVEILTDGASALYGADAVAGVVNIITKKRSGEGTISIGGLTTANGGSNEFRISFTRGFGDLGSDGYNFNVALSYDRRGTLQATQRDFAKTGIVSYVDEDGETLRADLGLATSKRSVPANLNLYVIDPTTGAPSQIARINPALAANGACPPFHIKSGSSCRFDFTSQLEVYPDRERMNAFFSFDKQLGENLKWSNEFLIGRTTSTSRIAPPPGELPIVPGTATYNTAIALAKSQGYYPIGVTPGAGDPALVDSFDPTLMDANLRFTELGKRTNINQIVTGHLASSLEGRFGDWDYTASLVHSQNIASDTFGGGYASVSGVAALPFKGFNALLGLGEQSAAGAAAAEAAKIKGYWNGGKSNLDSLSLQGSRDIGKLDGGPMQLALGATLQRETLDARTGDMLGGRLTYQVDANGNPCAATGQPCVGTAIDQRFGDSGIQPAYKASRNTFGAFGELALPFTKQFELTTSLRADHTNDFGNSVNGKLAARFQPSKSLLFRSSLGTGYIAPSLAQVNAPQQNFGVTQSAYGCSGDPASAALQTLANQLGVICDDGAQFQQFAKGTAGLQPEKSRQFTLGVLAEPTGNTKVGLDFWTVHIRDAIGQVTEQTVFADPLKFSRYFTTFVDPLTAKKLLAFIAPNENLGKAVYTGIDFNAELSAPTGLGKWTSNVVGTYMLKSVQQQEKGGRYFSDIAGEDDQQSVTFRWQGKWINTLDMGNWSNTLTLNFKSGYKDGATNPTILTGANAGNEKTGYRVSVKPYYTIDWYASYQFTKEVKIALGAINLTNKKPPFVFSQGGLNRGQEVGWDGRYYDPRGRMLSANLTATF